MKISYPTLSCLMLPAMVFLFACSKEKNAATDVEIPSLEKGCFSGQCVKGQFETTYQRFALINGDMVNLRSKPAPDSRVIRRLPITKKVTLLYEDPREATIGGIKGRWVFIQDAADLNLRGWVFDHFIGNADCFQKAEKWRVREIRVILGGKLTIYKCTVSGRFEITPTKADKKRDPKSLSGGILQCGEIVWLRKDAPDDHLIFFHVLKNGNLELPDQYKGMRGIVITNR